MDQVNSWKTAFKKIEGIADHIPSIFLKAVFHEFTWSILEYFVSNNSKCQKLLGIKFECRLRFDSHVTALCIKVSQKLNALSRVAGCREALNECFYHVSVFIHSGCMKILQS